ncbi:LysE family translocator [Actinoplanes sp. TFC3]|uniref:LysE family translocator n=1 Tax=Actinoplanes sp. TFC3 TaxID=1710355 RepID=UPI00082B007B|nr:LysE family translocator [Actinoplanes sp. TFC3]
METGALVDVTVLPTFLAAVVLICVAPGPDMAYMVATGIAGGRSAASRAAFGVSLGVVVYAILVAAGLGLVVARHPTVLTALQIFGCAYLLWLAYDTWRDARSESPLDTDAEDHGWFRRGLIVNLSNPKCMLFFLAFLPQFLGGAKQPVLQMLMLGLLFQVIGLIVDMAIGWGASSVRDRILSRPRALRAMTYVSASVFVVLAAVVGIEGVRSL